MLPDIKKVQSELQEQFIAYVPAIDKAAADLYQKDPER